MTNLTAFIGAAATLFLFSSCATPERPHPQAGGLVIPFELSRLPKAKPGFGAIGCVFDTPADQKYPTKWRITGYDFQGEWRQVSAPGSRDVLPVRAATYVIEFKSRNESRPAPYQRTVEVLEEQALTMRVSYTCKAGSKDCQ